MIFWKIDPVAQLEEHQNPNLKAAGSSPAGIAKPG